jgi:DNA-binding transcriptional regulator YdaS (Cro superfamily)
MRHRVKSGTKKKESAVLRAVSAVGGPTKAAGICGVSNTAIHKWIRRGSVMLLKHALRLSRASGIPIEELVGEEDDES